MKLEKEARNSENEIEDFESNLKKELKKVATLENEEKVL